ncbi:MBOAT family protein [Clostridiales bacterium COT073_COT-073]|nr:MBOAT family protein [Clostridiales bacterium COT073_COT-073]
MVFSSLFFIFMFLPICLIIYYQMPTRDAKNVVLIIASLCFYAWGEPIWISLLIFSATIDYFHGLIIERYRGSWQAKAAVASSLILNLGLLAIFKYSGMIVGTISGILGLNIEYQGFSLPIGISFYTFQTISYTIDVYRGETRAQYSYLKFLLFVSLFHQLVAGPIVRYVDIANEVENRVFRLEDFSYGVNRFILGLAKKVLIANTAGSLASGILVVGAQNASVLGSWFGMLLFAFQIYFDFSGYSDMAIGMGKMFGFTYKENFNYPYIATSATEFWRRWHISLGSFFRDYLYIPLGGNRSNPYRNLFIVWFLTGLWHGASWNFVVWGLYYGVFIGIEKWIHSKTRMEMPRIFGHIYCIFITLVGWVFFYFESLTDGIGFLKQMFGLAGLPLQNLQFEIVWNNNLYFTILGLIACTPLLGYIWKKLRLEEGPLLLVTNGVLFFASITMLVGQTYNPFLYFRF